jgi:glutamate carboxypeptidase
MFNWFLRTVSFFCLFFTPLIHAASLTPPEKAMVRFIQKEKPEQERLLEKLVEMNSGTSHVSGVHQVGEKLRPLFEKLGFKTHWVEEPASMHRAGTLVAEHPGTQGKRLLLIGHLDTVFPEASPFQHFKREGKLAKGPGVIDAKGGDVVILYALKALEAVRGLEGSRITVILTGDEEDAGKPTTISRKPLFEAAERSDLALDFEWSVAFDSATIARRGVANWLLQVEGKEAHSSEIFQTGVGAGANYELARILNGLRETFSKEPDLSLNPGLILGGTTFTYDKDKAQGVVFGKGNVLAQRALVKGDLRYLTAEQKTRTEKRMQELVSQHLTGTSATLSFQDGIPSMPPSQANLDLLELYSEGSEDLGYGKVLPLDPGKRGAGDISHIAALVSACLAGLGPVGTGAHSTQETLDLASLVKQTERAALLIYRLSR